MKNIIIFFAFHLAAVLISLGQVTAFVFTARQNPLIRVQVHQNDNSIITKQSSSCLSSALEVFEEDISLRFSGVGRLYHEENACSISKTEEDAPHMEVIDRLSNSTVAIVGIGGVGSWAAEAICRSGVGNIILLDLDDICTSNINRQVRVVSGTKGEVTQGAILYPIICQDHLPFILQSNLLLIAFLM